MEYPTIKAHHIQNVFWWSDNESTWEKKEDLENSEYKPLITKYTKEFSHSDIPLKIIGKSLLNDTLFVRWRDGSYQFTSDVGLIYDYPELCI
ncbi:hypothetical protein EIN_408530 [Entamoeba invadens IP1]|uniref:Uncharacterized protein n=1 Tax=Entamoeba invadens IP1 TaxID=370355 RepID=A0A0A1TWK9_ENTIV|nr:hypothetical protein EIN_408530 [Entamoeba invadens IP1]ELP85584.1 hypothetical protein EIN_408530 [Entamoeba invadens IP1]|eukprot:XP_004184930.1 hypothetical protein EIN_408530 [Entamoeba invadens IP1]